MSFRSYTSLSLIVLFLLFFLLLLRFVGLRANEYSDVFLWRREGRNKKNGRYNVRKESNSTDGGKRKNENK